MQITFMSQKWQIRDSQIGELAEDTLGLCDPRTNTIIVEANLPLDVWQQTCAHELVHLIEITLNLCLTEQQVDTIATGLIHLLKENPELIQLYKQSQELDSFTQGDYQ